MKSSFFMEEDCGAGDSIDRSLASASGNALKGAVTDAMKRASRHFGEKLGNSLYHDGFNANNAPATLKESLDNLDIERAKSRFGFDKDRKVPGQTGVIQTKAGNKPTAIVKQETTKSASIHAASAAKSSYGKPTPRTQYVGNVVMENSHQAKENHAKPPHVTPHHGATSKQNAGKSITSATPGSRSAISSNKKSNFDPSIFAAVSAEELQRKGKENSNPQVQPSNAGLALPLRPGTSRGAALSPTSAYISSLSENQTTTPSMFGANCAISQALERTQPASSIAQSLKRKSPNNLDVAGSVAKSANTSSRNPYNC